MNSDIGCAVIDYRSGVLMRQTELHGNSIHVFAEVHYILHSDYLAWHFLPTMCSGCIRVTCCVACRYGWIQGVPVYCTVHVFTPCDSYIGAECDSNLLRATCFILSEAVVPS